MSLVTDQFQKLFGGNAAIAPQSEINKLGEKAASKYNTTFFLDLTNIRYKHMNANCAELTGYSAGYLIDGGVDSYIDLWRPNDANLYLNKIILDTMNWLSKTPATKSSNYVFGRTYILKSKQGDERKILERDIFLFHPASLTPVAVTGYATDITHVSDMNKTTFFIEDCSKRGSDRIIYKEDMFDQEEQRVLTTKELEVLRWLIEGLSSKQIADRMNVSIHTIHNHRKHMLSKTGSMNAADLVKYAFSHRLV